MLTDDVIITITAGNGGRGAVAFNKNMMMLGPTGGSGGRGGSVFFEGVSDFSALNQFRYKKTIIAPDGKDGRGQFRDGFDGKDLVIRVPVGTVIHNLTTQTDQEITQIGEKIRVAKGGRGGRGNFHFRGPRNTSPQEFEEGRPGETFSLRLELKLIADIGLIGLPNVGKSSLLNELTGARSKVANYRFTTLEPHLGVWNDLILADIPGLIEGASEGKGLGDKFLRHIERTKVLFHLVAADSADPRADYQTIRMELERYNPALLDKDEYVFLSKSDEDEPKETAKKIRALKKLNPQVSALSIIDPESMQRVRKILNAIEKQKHATPSS